MSASSEAEKETGSCAKLAARVNDLALTANLFHSRPHYWIHKCVRDFKPNLLAVAYIDYRKVSFDSNCLKEEKSE